MTSKQRLSEDIIEIIQNHLLESYHQEILERLRSVVFPSLRLNRRYQAMQGDSPRYDYSIDYMINGREYFEHINNPHDNCNNNLIIRPFIKIRLPLDEKKLIYSSSTEAMKVFGLDFDTIKANYNNLTFQTLYSGLEDLVWGWD